MQNKKEENAILRLWNVDQNPHFAPNVKSLGVNAFSGCDYTEINLPEGLEFIATSALTCGDYAQLHIPTSVKEMGLCTGYFTGDLYIHGMNTKFKSNDFYGMPMVVHAPAGSYAAKCADAGTFNAKSPTFLGRGTTISEGFCVVLVWWLTL